MAQLWDWKRDDKPAPSQYKELNALLDLVDAHEDQLDAHGDHDIVEVVPLPVKVVECHDISSTEQSELQSEAGSIDVDILAQEMFSTPVKPNSSASSFHSPIVKVALRRINIKTTAPAGLAAPISDSSVGIGLANLLASASALGSLKPGTKTKGKRKKGTAKSKRKKAKGKNKNKNAKGKNKNNKAAKAAKAAKAKAKFDSPSADALTESGALADAHAHAGAEPLSELDVDMNLIKHYTPLDVESRPKIKKQFHSKIWHTERQRCIKMGMSDSDAKTRASRVVTHAVANWIKFHIDGEDFD
jgi:hypothetical protein